MHDERLALALWTQMRHELIDNRVGVLLPLERHSEEPGGLVEDDERLVFVEDAQIARPHWRAASRTAWPIHPDADAVSDGKSRRSRIGRCLDVVHEHLRAI